MTGSADYTVNPGAETDQGEVLSSGVPVDFDGFGSGDTLALAGTGAGTVTVNGTAANDVFTVEKPAAVDTVTITGRATITATALPTATLNADEGEDEFHVNGNNTLTTLNVNGGDGDDDDTLNVFNNAGAATVDLGLRTVAGYGALINYTGLEAIDADANAQNLTVNATGGDDTVEVTPLDATSGSLQANDEDPVLNYSNLGGLFTVDLLTGGQDRLVVYGNSTDETIDINTTPSTVQASGQTITYANAEALRVDGQEGSDTFNVTPSATTEIFIDGGDAIGVVGDTLNVLAAPGDVTFAPGPEADEGGFAFTVAAPAPAVAPVSYDHIEALSLDLNGNDFLVNATNADDDIKVVGSQTAGVEDEYLISVNASPAISVINSGELTIDGLHGDDDIDIDVFNLNLAKLTVKGNNPSVAGDTLTVEGWAGDDAAIWRPTAFDGGTFDVGNQTITVETMERLIYDGRDDAENLTVELPTALAGNLVAFELDTFTFRGSVNVNRDGQPLLGLEFEDISALGTVTIDGATNDGDDTLLYGGRDVIDQIVVANVGGVGVITNDPMSIPVWTPGVKDLVLLGRNGNDVFDITSDHPYESIIVTGDGSDAGATADANGDQVLVRGAANREEQITVTPNAYIDSETYIRGTGVTQDRNISTSGVERIYYVGADADDVLVVDPGQGTHTVRVDGGRFTGTPGHAAPLMDGPFDRVTSDSLPEVFGGALKTLRVAPATGAAGNVAVTFVTGDLTQAANYEAVLGGDDTLVIEGSDGLGDEYKVTKPTAAVAPFVVPGSVAIEDLSNGVMVTEISNELGRLQINTLGGDDTVTIDVDATPLITVPITFDGGANSDLLQVQGTPTGGAVSATYRPGPAVTEGRLTWVNAATMTVDIANLEPVIDLVPGTLTVQGTDADNAIDYRAAGVNGLVSVDGFETLQFANKTDVTLNGGAGSDAFHLAATNAGFTGTMFIHGDEPALSGDVLVVNGAAGTVTVDHANGTVAGVLDAAAAQLVDYGTIERLLVNAGASATLAMTGSADYTVNPGAETDQGEVLSSGVPVDFDGFGAGATVDLVGSGVVTAVVNGTAANDAFTVADNGTQNDVTIAGRATVEIDDGSTVTLNAYAGADTFTVDGQNGLAVLNLHGGDGDDDDLADLNTPSVAVMVDLEAQTVAGYGAVINYNGLQTIDADAGQMAINVTGTAADEDVTVTVFDGDSGKIERGYAAQRAGQVSSEIQDPVIYYGNADGQAANFDLAGGQDTLIVVGSTFGTRPPLADAPQVFDVDVPARSVTVDDQNDAVADGLVTWVADGIESLEVWGLEGDDTFDVAPGSIPVFIDGGDPIGVTAGDLINIQAGSGLVAFEPGPESDEGGFTFADRQRVSFDHIEALGVFNATCALVLGTHADDDITIVARDDSTHAVLAGLTPGVHDFTTVVNASPEILWVDTANLYVDALSGDDDIVLRTPAPNDALWDVHVRIAGGLPSDGADNEGDRFVLETPLQNTMEWTPSGSDSGRVLLDQGVVAASTGDIAVIDLGPFTTDCGGDDPYVSSVGGVELFEYDGEAADDAVRVVGTAGDDTITHRPGPGDQEGTIRVNSLLGVDYQNLGDAGLVGVTGGSDGNDTLVVDGTMASDNFRVIAASGNVELNSRLPIQGVNAAMNPAPSVENLVLNGLEGDDTFTVNLSQPYATVTVHGGGPGNSDVLWINGDAGADEDFSVNPAATPGDGLVTVNALDNNYTGIEHVFVAGNAAADSLTVNDDGRDNTWDVSKGTHGDVVQIDGRESIDYATFGEVKLVNTAGTDLFRVAPTNLAGAPTSLIVEGGAATDDVLELIGTPAADAVTLSGSVVTVNTKAVTVGNANFAEIRVTALAGNDSITASGDALSDLRRVIDAGAGNDTVDLKLITSTGEVLISGGDGDDELTGTAVADMIYGDAGNDTIVGFKGDDLLFGGTGSDTFVWNDGDGSDVVEGDEGVDVQIVNGGDADDHFVLRTKSGDERRAYIELASPAAVPWIDLGKVEQVDLYGEGGGDTMEVKDLFTTDVRQVNVGAGTDAAADAVIVEGRSVADGVALTPVDGKVNIAGLVYDVNAGGLDAPGDADTLTFNGNAGDDLIYASDNLSAIFGAVLAEVDRLILNGGEGDDSITGFGQLNGEAGDDMLKGGDHPQSITGGDGADQLYGGGGKDLLNGGAGEDLFVGGPGFEDTIDGGDTLDNIEWDTILVRGTSGSDTIDVSQTAPNRLTHVVKTVTTTVTETDILGLLADGTRTVDEVRVEAGSGADLIRTRITDVAGGMAEDAVYNAVVVTVHGGSATGAGDRLIVIDDGPDDLTLYRKSQDDAAGTVSVGPGNVESFETVFDGIERIQFLDEAGLAVNAEPGNGSRLVVFKHDPYEYNDDRFVATHLGAGDVINVDPTIDPGALLNPFADIPAQDVPGDADWFRFEAQVTGTLDLQVFFEVIEKIASSNRPGLPGDGNLDIHVYDLQGQLLAGDGPDFGINDATDDERIRIPVVQGQTYFLRVSGVEDAINNYSLTALNTVAPAPYDMELRDLLDSGAVQAAPAPSATVFAGPASLSSVDDFYTGKYVCFVGGELIGQRARIADYDGATRAFSLAAGAVTGTPAAGDAFFVESFDTGRSQWDNETRDNTPVVYFRLDDALLLYDLPGNGMPDTPPDEVIAIPFNDEQIRDATKPGYRVAVFDEGTPQQPDALPQTPIGYARKVADGVYVFDFERDAINSAAPNGAATAFTLTDGSHFLSARVQMVDPNTNFDTDSTLASVQSPAGFSARSVSLEIVVDTQVPPVYFGLPASAQVPGSQSDGLHPDSDTGIENQQETFVDRITSDTTPTLWGTAEADAVVRVYLDVNNDGLADAGDILLGMTVAAPLDGSNQFPGGRWELTSTIDMNDPDVIASLVASGVVLAGEIDGLRPLIVTAEDVAGNLTESSDAVALDALAIFIDSRGPQVAQVNIAGHEPYDLFDPKPSTDGPTPLAWSLDVDFIDRPRRGEGGAAVTPKIDVFLLFDDTGSFAGTAPTLVAAFPQLIVSLQTALPGADLAFGVGRFEEYGNFFDEDPDGRPFVLNQPILALSDPDFTAAINAALDREAPGYGGDAPETAIEGLWQLATGAGFDGNNDGDTTDSGPAGLVSTQVAPGVSGDVPAYASFTSDPSGPVVAASGTLGGAGFRSGAAKLILLATDTGFAFQPDGLNPYVGVNGVTVAAADVQTDGRSSTPFGSGATIQATIDALLALDGGTGAQVIGLGDDTDPNDAPRHNLEALAVLTGALNQTGASMSSGIVGDPIGPNEPLYFFIDPNSGQTVADAILQAVIGAVNSGFLYPAVNEVLATTPGNYLLVGDANGSIPIKSVEFIDSTAPGDFGRTTVRLNFFEPLPDDRYTLTVFDRNTDVAGNKLDGETNTTEPQENPYWPSGDGEPGEDFVARFTVDSRPEIGVYHSGSVWVDTNGNFTFDPDNPDFTNRDITYVLGFTTDNLFAGNFSAPGAGRVADGFDKLAAYGRVGSGFRWLIDTDNDGVPNPLTGIVEPMGTTGMPFAGNFDGDADNGDEVGLLAGNQWYFDTNHDYQLDKVITLSLTGLPIVGDFDGDGFDDLGTWQDDQFTFLLTGDSDPDPDKWDKAWLKGTAKEATITKGNFGSEGFGFIGVREKPVAADMDQDGIDDIGLWVPDRAGVAPVENGEWYFLVSNDHAGTKREHGKLVTLDHPFTPVPFGKDLYASFGDEFAVPVIGNFDPPVTGGSETPSGATNPVNRFDVNADGYVNAQDVVILVNDINLNGIHAVSPTLVPPFKDVNGDGYVSPVDVLNLITAINGQDAGGDLGGEGEGEGFAEAAVTVTIEPASPSTAVLADSLSGVPVAGLLAEPWSAPALAAPAAAAQVDQYFTQDADQADAVSVYAGDLADAVLASAAQTQGPGDAAVQDDLLADLAADEGRLPAEEEEADGVFAQIGRFFRRLV